MRVGFCDPKVRFKRLEACSSPSSDDGGRLMLWNGLVLATETFPSVSADYVVDDSDGWTLRTVALLTA